MTNDTTIGIATLPTFQFGNTPEMADRLASLVVAGRKTASCWAAKQEEKLTPVGARWVALDSAQKPVAVIETVSVTRLPFSAVTPALAALEGEGDLSHAYWADVHETYFRGEGTWAPDMELCFEIFRLVATPDEAFARNASAHVIAEIAEARADAYAGGAYVVHDGAPDAETLLRLRGAAGLTVYPIEQAKVGAANSLFGVTVKLNGDVIGIGRIIGDGGFFFTVTDIAVLPTHHGKGVGRLIMTRITDWLRANAPAKSFVSLFADEGVPPLYEKFGFRICGAEDTGMVWKRDAQ